MITCPGRYTEKFLPFNKLTDNAFKGVEGVKTDVIQIAPNISTKEGNPVS